MTSGVMKCLASLFVVFLWNRIQSIFCFRYVQLPESMNIAEALNQHSESLRPGKLCLIFDEVLSEDFPLFVSIPKYLDISVVFEFPV